MDAVNFLVTILLVFQTAAGNEELIRSVNQHPDSCWIAGKSKFQNSSVSFVSALGTRWLSEDLYSRLPRHRGFHPTLRTHIPTEFDARKQWPNCTTIGEIRSQGECGSCWAHVVAGVMSDRICIFSTSGSLSVHLSVENLLSCCIKCGSCNGGLVEFGFEYFKTVGLVTGSNYGARKTGCRPYSVPEGPRKIWGHNSTTPVCKKFCANGYRIPYYKDMHNGTWWYTVSNSAGHGKVTPDTPINMQLEIMQNGPVSCSMKVHEDFEVYKSGVYTHVTGKMLGGHAMKCIGWGVDSFSKKPYWLVANSFGKDWGEQGFGRILRGTNEGGIESRVCAGTPRRY